MKVLRTVLHCTIRLQAVNNKVLCNGRNSSNGSVVHSRKRFLFSPFLSVLFSIARLLRVLL